MQHFFAYGLIGGTVLGHCERRNKEKEKMFLEKIANGDRDYDGKYKKEGEDFWDNPVCDGIRAVKKVANAPKKLH